MDNDDVTLLGAFYNPAANATSVPAPLPKSNPPTSDVIRNTGSNVSSVRNAIWEQTARRSGFGRLQISALVDDQREGQLSRTRI